MYKIKEIQKKKKKFSLIMKKRGIMKFNNIFSYNKKLIKIKIIIFIIKIHKNNMAKIISIFFDRNFIYKEIGLFLKNKLLFFLKEYKKNNKIINIISYSLPNIIDIDVPFGKKEKDNKIIKIFNKKKDFFFKLKSHYNIANNLKLIDFKSATKISGSRFVILKKSLAKLERILINFMLDICTKKFGYDEISPPILVLEEIMIKSGQLPKFSEDSFKTNSGHRLIPTSEVPLISMLSNKTILEKNLPLRMTSNTPCFRLEVGSSGNENKGIIRLHQFYKVELISIVKPNESKNELDKIINVAEYILKKLELPYRIVMLCSYETGFCSSKTYDLEVWSPYKKKYIEISSCSNCKKFQSMRLNIKYKSLYKNKKNFVHTLNGSALAIGRTIASIIENYQNLDGSITIPKVLVPYMKQEKIL